MKKIRAAKLDIVIEWRSKHSGAAPRAIGPDVTREDVLELARALGRLAARRDIEEANARRGEACPSSDENLLQCLIVSRCDVTE